MFALIDFYKEKAGIQQPKNRKTLIKEGGQNRYEAYLSLIKNSKKFRPVNADELKEVLPHLQGIESARILIEGDIEALELNS